jgi:hypothetical protein
MVTTVSALVRPDKTSAQLRTFIQNLGLKKGAAAKRNQQQYQLCLLEEEKNRAAIPLRHAQSS